MGGGVGGGGAGGGVDGGQARMRGDPAIRGEGGRRVAGGGSGKGTREVVRRGEVDYIGGRSTFSCSVREGLRGRTEGGVSVMAPSRARRAPEPIYPCPRTAVRVPHAGVLPSRGGRRAMQLPEKCRPSMERAAESTDEDAGKPSPASRHVASGKSDTLLPSPASPRSPPTPSMPPPPPPTTPELRRISPEAVARQQPTPLQRCLLRAPTDRRLGPTPCPFWARAARQRTPSSLRSVARTPRRAIPTLRAIRSMRPRLA